jgi:hypothetical protein
MWPTSEVHRDFRTIVLLLFVLEFLLALGFILDGK